ncbi:hypothetical protein [Bradyrhizobium ottawaense]
MAYVILSLEDEAPDLTLQQRLAASALLVTCEKIAAAGWLPEREEQSLRALLPRVYQTFNVPSPAERVRPLEIEGAA